VVASGRVADLEASLERLLSEPRLLARMVSAAKQRDVSRWSIERMEPEVERIIQTIAAAKHGAPIPDALASV
jgi:hypothetical protein